MMAMAQTIRWAYAEQHGFRLLLAKSGKGLCYVGSPGEGLVEMQQHCAKRFPSADFVQDPQALTEYQYTIEAWLAGSRETYSLPLDVAGTEFQRSIWQALQEIPYGQTVSYSELAERIGKPQAIRAAGSAVGANPLLLFIPCHRVIRKNGDATGFRGGMELKHHLLKTEQN
ncbi:cysteine methyltransferase [Planococcus rifietoensis]|uniref:methylated-DNA--[protein]-cysteine S-methyltransferase n=2 Tax=Planococcus rifietoensis TaxID=200991 RepID=A0A0U2Z5Y7_9BACL|nr:cysteine methyltransferase [Planococcus rifietoensis]